MSYILEALKKAEAERSTEKSRQLHVPPPFGMPYARKRAVWDRSWIWAGAGACMALLIGFAWMKPWQAVPPSMPAAVSVPAQASPRPPDAVPAAPVKQEVVQEKPAEKLARSGPRSAARTTRKAPEKKSVPASAAHDAGRQAPAQSASVTEERLLTRHQLPQQIQQEIPPLSVSGYLYSGNPADRSAVINSRLLREGDQVAPGFVLEKMMPDGMVLNYKGYRYRSGY